MISLQAKNTQGFALIEAMLATVILALIATAFLGVSLQAQQATARASNQMQAIFLAEEGLEVVRVIRDLDPEGLSAGTYGLAWSGSAWSLVGTPTSEGIFLRTVNISDLGGEMWEITATVYWQIGSSQSQTVVLTTRLSEWAAIVIPPPPPPV